MLFCGKTLPLKGKVYLMQLPNAAEAFIDYRKLIAYCLSFEHEEGKHKARVFASALGITADNFFVLKEAIKEAVLSEDAIVFKKLASGTLYQLDFKMVYQDCSVSIRSGWIILNHEDFPRLTTCFVLD